MMMMIFCLWKCGLLILKKMDTVYSPDLPEGKFAYGLQAG